MRRPSSAEATRGIWQARFSAPYCTSGYATFKARATPHAECRDDRATITGVKGKRRQRWDEAKDGDDHEQDARPDCDVGDPREHRSRGGNDPGRARSLRGPGSQPGRFPALPHRSRTSSGGRAPRIRDRLRVGALAILLNSRVNNPRQDSDCSTARAAPSSAYLHRAVTSRQART